MMIILNPELDDEGFAGELENVQTRLTDLGGQVHKVDAMGRRRLAYAIKKRVAGYYAVLRFQFPVAQLAEFERWLKLNENVLRYLNIRLED